MVEENKNIMTLTWRPEPDGEALDVRTANHYKSIGGWKDAFILMARSVVGFFSRDGADPEEVDFQASLLLRKSAMSMKIDPFVVQALGVEDSKHPGEVDVPDAAWQSDEAKEILSIWIVPNAEMEEDGLPSPFYLSGNTDSLPYTKIGELLAHVAFRHIFFACKGDENLRIVMLAQIQKDFMKRFDYGMTRQ